jgi:VanZ family protein
MYKVAVILGYIVLVIFSLFFNFLSIVVPEPLDKILHFISFVVFSYYSIYLYQLLFKNKFINYFLVIFAFLGIIYVSFLEVGQKYVPARNCDFFDWLAGTSAVFFAVASFYMYENYKSKKL